MTLFIFMFLFRLTTKTYLLPHVLVYLPIYIPVHELPVHFHTSIQINRQDLPVSVSTALHVHIWTRSSAYLFSLFLLFQHNIHNYLSTLLLGYVHTDLPENKVTCLSSCFSLSNHKDLPVITTTCISTHTCTRS